MTKGNRHCCLGVVEQARWLIICTAYSKVWEQCKSSRRAEQQYCHNIVTTCQLARSKFRLQLRNKQHKRHKSLLEGGEYGRISRVSCYYQTIIKGRTCIASGEKSVITLKSTILSMSSELHLVTSYYIKTRNGVFQGKYFCLCNFTIPHTATGRKQLLSYHKVRKF